MHIGSSPLAAVPVILAACAAQPSPGSLQALHHEVRQETWEACMRTQFTENRYVTLRSLADRCDRVVRVRHGPVRR